MHYRIVYRYAERSREDIVSCLVPFERGLRTMCSYELFSDRIQFSRLNARLYVLSNFTQRTPDKVGACA
jgi:hypothetical protein